MATRVASKPSPETIIRFVFLFAFGAVYLAEFIAAISRQDAFTWMDPYQYFEFARDVSSGVRAFNQFQLPSVFPFFIVPFLAIRPSISFALGANTLFMAALLFAGYRLCVHFNVRKWYYAVAVPFLCSPLIIGLSHSLYAELALSAC